MESWVGAMKGLPEAIPSVRISTDPGDLLFYGRDETRHWNARPSAIVFPETVEEVQSLVRWARSSRTALVPSGGRTGLSGGAVAANGEVVVSMQRMNRIVGFAPGEPSITVQPGVTTHQLQEAARENGYFYPVDFASRGSSQIGGNIATNAGGIRVLRYGMTRDWVAGVTVVTGAGDVLALNQGLVKNATGYDLRHLMIGSEGTLGIVVEAEMRLTRPPMAQQVAVLAVPRLEVVAEVFQQLSACLELSAFEFFDQHALEHVISAGERRPFDSSAPYYVLAEFDEDTDAATSAFGEALSNGSAIDGVLSQSEAQASALWRLRESISATLAPRAPYKCDIAVRRSGVVAFMKDLEAQVASAFPDLDLVWFGHVGDGNLHLNVLRPEAMSPERFAENCAVFTDAMCRILSVHGGTISAEHGVGMLKKPYLHHTRSRAEIDYMRAVKLSFDPDGILNPGKIFDQAT